jgi:MerR family mercuric resistance operon transcriptional regulator
LARRRLGFVRRARELGFSIDDIRALLTLAKGDAHCTEVYALTVRHLASVRDRIADLQRLERTLARTAGECARDASPDCPIIEALSNPAP